MNIIQGGRWDNLFRRYFGMKGAPAIAPELDATIQPVIVMQDDAPELSLLKATRRYMTQGFQAAVAGQLSHIMLINPAGSGVLAVVEFWQIANGPAAAHVAGAVANIALGVAGPAVQSVDLRDPLTSATCQVRTLAQVADNLVGNIFSRTTTASESFVNLKTPPGIVLPPGTGWACRSTANVAAAANITWTERSMEAGEGTV